MLLIKRLLPCSPIQCWSFQDNLNITIKPRFHNHPAQNERRNVQHVVIVGKLMFNYCIFYSVGSSLEVAVTSIAREVDLLFLLFSPPWWIMMCQPTLLELWPQGVHNFVFSNELYDIFETGLSGTICSDLIFVTNLTNQVSGENIAMWRNFSFPCMTIVEKSKISPHVE